MQYCPFDGSPCRHFRSSVFSRRAPLCQFLGNRGHTPGDEHDAPRNRRHGSAERPRYPPIFFPCVFPILTLERQYTSCRCPSVAARVRFNSCPSSAHNSGFRASVRNPWGLLRTIFVQPRTSCKRVVFGENRAYWVFRQYPRKHSERPEARRGRKSGFFWALSLTRRSIISRCCGVNLNGSFLYDASVTTLLRPLPRAGLRSRLLPYFHLFNFYGTAQLFREIFGLRRELRTYAPSTCPESIPHLRTQSKRESHLLHKAC